MTSIQSALEDGQALLQKATGGQDCARLLQYLLKCSDSYLLLYPDQVLDKAIDKQYWQLLGRYQQGEPLAYLLGSQGFWTLDLKVTPATLIPRPDTELLVELALQLGDKDQPLELADLGTGSGAIALSLAYERPNWSVLATDVSLAALKVATENRDRYGLNKVSFCQGSWYAPLSPNYYQIIVSNPPYIRADDGHLGALSFEPHSALVAKEQGLADLYWLIDKGPHYLQQKGWLLLEHGYDQAEMVRQAFIDRGYKKVKSVRDLGNNERVTLGQIDG